MPFSLAPLSEVPAASVKEYLHRQGIPADIVEWKYFDARFSKGRERGYVLLRDGRVSGFLGYIPFTMRLRERSIPTAWSCDWSCDPDAGAAGILLLKQTLCAYDPFCQLGGNENTRRILPRIASLSVPDAGVLHYLPLRLGAILRLAARRTPGIPLDRVDLLNRLPLGLAPGRKAAERVRVESGISPVMAPVLGAARSAPCYPQYDLEYVQWQVGRCPTTEPTTVYLPSAGGSPAAAVCWRQKPAGVAWRMAVWAMDGAQRELDIVLCGALRHIHQARGEMVSVLASRLDSDLLAALKARRFLTAARRRMFAVVSGGAGSAFEEASGFSLLDTDMSYRF